MPLFSAFSFLVHKSIFVEVANSTIIHHFDLRVVVLTILHVRRKKKRTIGLALRQCVALWSFLDAITNKGILHWHLVNYETNWWFRLLRTFPRHLTILPLVSEPILISFLVTPKIFLADQVYISHVSKSVTKFIWIKKCFSFYCHISILVHSDRVLAVCWEVPEPSGCLPSLVKFPDRKVFRQIMWGIVLSWSWVAPWLTSDGLLISLWVSQALGQLL